MANANSLFLGEHQTTQWSVLRIKSHTNLVRLFFQLLVRKLWYKLSSLCHTRSYGFSLSLCDRRYLLLSAKQVDVWIYYNRLAGKVPFTEVPRNFILLICLWWES